MSSGVGVVLANIRGMSRGDAGREEVWIFEVGSTQEVWKTPR
jgi:hypothetical protein